MVGLKARSTLVPAETWLKEFVPYGTPCDEPCEPNTKRLDELLAEIADLRAEVEALREAITNGEPDDDGKGEAGARIGEAGN